MPGIAMLCVAALTQYRVGGFFGSAAEAGDRKQTVNTAATQVVLLRRFMVISSLTNRFFSCPLFLTSDLPIFAALIPIDEHRPLAGHSPAS